MKLAVGDVYEWIGGAFEVTKLTDVMAEYRVTKAWPGHPVGEQLSGSRTIIEANLVRPRARQLRSGSAGWLLLLAAVAGRLRAVRR